MCRGEDDVVGPGADPIACGVLLYALLSAGRPPFVTEKPASEVTMKHIAETPAPERAPPARPRSRARRHRPCGRSPSTPRTASPAPRPSPTRAARAGARAAPSPTSLLGDPCAAAPPCIPRTLALAVTVSLPPDDDAGPPAPAAAVAPAPTLAMVPEPSAAPAPTVAMVPEPSAALPVQRLRRSPRDRRSGTRREGPPSAWCSPCGGADRHVPRRGRGGPLVGAGSAGSVDGSGRVALSAVPPARARERSHRTGGGRGSISDA